MVTSRGFFLFRLTIRKLFSTEHFHLNLSLLFEVLLLTVLNLRDLRRSLLVNKCGLDLGLQLLNFFTLRRDFLNLALLLFFNYSHLLHFFGKKLLHFREVYLLVIGL